MRIAFAGASGTGKTYLATRLSAELGLELNPVGSRQVARQMGFDSPYDCDGAGKRAEFQRALLTAKTAWEQDRLRFCTDRTTIDNLAYTVLHDVACVDAAMLQQVQQHLHRYTHIIVCTRATFHRLGDDPARVADPTYHELYETCLLGLLERYRGPYTRIRQLVLSGADERYRACREFVTERR